MFYCWCFFLLFSTRDLRAPSADRRETLPSDRMVLPHDNLGPTISGAFPKKLRGHKRAKLGSISNHSKLQLRISPERMEISKIGKTCDRQRFIPWFGEESPVNFGPLITPFYMQTLTHPNQLLRKTVFRPLKGAAGSNCYTLYRMTIPPGTGVSPTISNSEHSKIGLQFCVCAPITLGPSRTFSTWRAARQAC